ncbi:MAG TPA: hypothetical protein VGQ62_04170 [Chloroflexota bacterium]|jgi:CO/xanthine dehydrogenase Mo-binding subunit|nr:hypothetical protein [Chloroflexota bacterium]
MEPGLVEDERYSPPLTSPHGTHIASVSIDRVTGRLEMELCVVVEDAE